MYHYNEEGWVRLSEIATFTRMKRQMKNNPVEALLPILVGQCRLNR